MEMLRRFGTVLSVAAAISCATPARAASLYAEYPVAAIESGRTTSGKQRLEVIAAGIVYNEPDLAWDPFQRKTILNCARDGVAQYAMTLGKSLGETSGFRVVARIDTTMLDLARSSVAPVTLAQVNEARDRRSAAVGAEIYAAQQDVGKRFAQCVGPSAAQALGDPVIVLTHRTCTPTNAPIFSSCRPGNVGTGKLLLDERVFAQVYLWMHSRGEQQMGVSVGAATARDDVKPVDVTVAVPVQSMPALDVRLSEFEALVNYLRSLPKNNQIRKAKLSSALPRAIGLTKNSAARVLDLLNSPMEATALLKEGEQTLARISDEVARSRLIECTQFRRISVEDLAKLGSCAGYSFSTEMAYQCLNHERCFPPLRAEAMAAVLRITEDFEMRDLALDTMFPRVGADTIGAWELAARECALENKSVPQGDFQRLAMECALRRGFSGSERETLNCVLSKRGAAPAALVECLTDVPPTAAEAFRCWNEKGGDVTKAALCAAGSSIPPAIRTCVDGLDPAPSQDQLNQCLAGALGGGAELVAAMSCYQQHSTDRERLALCIAAPELPPDVLAMSKCATSASSWTGFASCAIEDQLPGQLGGDAGKVVRCGLQAQGDPVGTAVCLYGPKLNQDQQIVLQCAVATGGEPMSFATCAGGQLALKEFMQCKDVKFGEANCFGENNEIRRFSRALGLGDIHSNTVVGQIANAHLDVLKFQVRLAENVLKGTGQLLENVGRSIENVGKQADNLRRNLEDGVKSFFGSVGIKL